MQVQVHGTTSIQSVRLGLPVIRPPGSVDEATFLKACTRCEDCVNACPHDAIQIASSRFRGAQGTPIIDPASQPCLMCEDKPCIAACPTDALLSTQPHTIATAEIQTWTCLAHQGGTCSICAEHCPVPDAIRMENGRPVIDPQACTGCGVCQSVCPAPENAVRIMPLPDRPVPNGSSPDAEQ